MRINEKTPPVLQNRNMMQNGMEVLNAAAAAANAAAAAQSGKKNMYVKLP